MSNICDINIARSYKTLANLQAALEKMGFSNDRYVIAYNEKGRVTAIFQLDTSEGGYVARWAAAGFITV